MDHVLTSQILSYIPALAGAAGIPSIQQSVQFLREQFKLPKYLAPYASLAIGLIINVVISEFTKTPFVDGVMIGLLAGAGASGFHEISH